MSYTQFACSDFLRVLFQTQVDTEFKKKKKSSKRNIAQWGSTTSQRLTSLLMAAFSG